jgi:hypothetical protein
MKYENGHFEQEQNPDFTPEELQLEGLLSDAMQVRSPAGLSNRVADASIDALIEGQLDNAMSVAAPKGLCERIYSSSVASLQERPAVVGRIGISVIWRQVAMAACVVFAVLVGIRFGVQSSLQQGQSTDRSSVAIASTDVEVLSVEEEGLLLEDLNLTEFDYLAGTRELAFADVAQSMNSLRNDIELWQYGLLTE